jgi:TolB protein
LRSGWNDLMKVMMCCALFLMTAGAAGAEDVYLSIQKGAGEKISVAVPLFVGGGGMVDAVDVRDVLTFDLNASGYFRTIANTEFVDETETADRKSGKIAFPEWIALGGEILVKGSFDAGLSEFSLEATVYDLGQAQGIFAKRYTGTAEQWREAVHTLSNDLVELVSGEAGIALTKIAFVSNVSGSKQIYVMDYDGENQRRVTRDDLLAIYPEWFPDNKRLAYTRYRSQRQEACAVTVGSGAVQKLTSFPGLNAFVTVSPDGGHIAMSLSRDGNTEIYRLDADGTNPKRLTFGRSTESSPCWSPGGRRIAFVSDRSGTPQIYVMSTTGGTADRLTFNGGYNTSPDWSPKGGLIAYTAKIDGVFQICTVDVDTKEVVRLTTGRENKEDPSWAPDGRHIVYSMASGGKSDLYMLDTFEKEPIRLTIGGGDYLSPAWSR